MEVDEEFLRVLTHMQEKSARIERQQMLRNARRRIPVIRDHIDTVRIVANGVMAGVDQRFDSTETFRPSTMIRTQLRLAAHYLQAADGNESPDSEAQPPTLSSYVVLRAAIESTASAHWLMSGKNHRESVKRVLKRMWWDTESAVEMAATADGNVDRSALEDLKKRITAISSPIKGLEVAKVTESKRMPLSTIVKDAGAALHPDYPSMMRAGWMLCSGIAHGNIPVSAGAGITPATVQLPSQHLIDDEAYAFVLSTIVEDLHLTALLFEKRAAEQHAHQQTPRDTSDHTS